MSGSRETPPTADNPRYVTLDSHRRAVLLKALEQYASTLDYTGASSPRERRLMDEDAAIARILLVAFAERSG